jgi:hypothetical protein
MGTLNAPVFPPAVMLNGRAATELYAGRGPHRGCLALVPRAAALVRWGPFVALILCMFTAVQWPFVQRILGIYHEQSPARPSPSNLGSGRL